MQDKARQVITITAPYSCFKKNQFRPLFKKKNHSDSKSMEDSGFPSITNSNLKTSM